MKKVIILRNPLLESYSPQTPVFTTCRVFEDGVSTNLTFNAWYNTFKAQAHALATLKRMFVPSKGECYLPRQR